MSGPGRIDGPTPFVTARGAYRTYVSVLGSSTVPGPADGCHRDAFELASEAK